MLQSVSQFSKGGLRKRILLPFVVLLLLVITLFVYSAYRAETRKHEDSLESTLNWASSLFENQINGDANTHRAVMELLADDQSLQNAFVAKDRETLLALAAPIFERLKSSYRITHFYFIGLDRVNFLRVHQPKRHGDVIDRYTTTEAQATGEGVSGIELGPFGTFTLRSVVPWLRDGEVIGYLELGEEIGHIADKITQIPGVNLAITIDKDLLDRDLWELGQKMLGYEGAWDRLKHEVLAGGVGGAVPDEFVRVFDENEHENYDRSIQVGDNFFRHSPLKDAAGRVVGDFVITHDAGPLLRQFREIMAINVVLSCLAASGIFIVFYILLGRVERGIEGAHQVLADSEALKRSVVEKALNGIITVDDQGLVVEFNPAALKMFGYEPDDVTGQDVAELIITPELRDRHRQGFSRYVETGEATVLDTILELEAIRASGAVFPIELTLTSNRVGERLFFTAFLTDISERKQAADRLIRHAELLERSNDELERFAYVASHDLQEPLRMVTSYSQLLAKRYKGKLDEEADTYIEFAVSGAKRMQTLIVDLLDYSRVGAQGTKIVTVDCNKVMDRVLADLAVSVQELGVEVHVDDLPTLQADSMQLERLFQNLLSNSIKYRDAERGLKIEVSVVDEPGEWVFSIVDNGIGIEPQFTERIFTIFQRLHGPEEYSGTGIGLAICKKVVDNHAGRIWVESTLGEGSAFCFTISKTIIRDHHA